jgi:hypothetical protein
MIINPYRYATGTGATGLLADYPNAAAAFSLRQLISTWTGAVVEVRRSNDNATADFTAAEVSNGTLTTWTGAFNGFVSTWYDQSGNGFDATQTTTANQPRVVDVGTLVTSNGEPAIDFDGSNYHLFNTTGGTTGNGNIPYNGGVSWYGVTDLDNVSSGTRFWSDDITGAQGYIVAYTGSTTADVQINDNNGGFKAVDTDSMALVQGLASFNFDDSTGDYEWARDGTNNTGSIAGWGGPIDSSNTANFAIMGSGNGNQLGDGKVQELIIYPNDQSANRVGIEGNINTHYSIY